MFEKVLGGGACIGVNCEARGYEISEALRPARADLGWISRNDIDHDAALWLTNIGRVALGHFKGENTIRPDINLSVVAAFTLDQLWCHPAESTNLAGPARLLLRQLGRVAEICQLDRTGLVSEDVVAFDVAMHDVVRVQVVQAFQCLPQDPLQGILSVVLFSTSHGLDNVGDGAVHELDEDPEDIPLIIVVGLLDVQRDALTLAHLHQGDLVEHEFFVLVGARGAELQSKLFLVCLAQHFVHLGETTDSKLFLAVDVVVRRGVFLLPNEVLFNSLLERCGRDKFFLLLED